MDGFFPSGKGNVLTTEAVRTLGAPQRELYGHAASRTSQRLAVNRVAIDGSSSPCTDGSLLHFHEHASCGCRGETCRSHFHHDVA